MRARLATTLVFIAASLGVAACDRAPEPVATDTARPTTAPHRIPLLAVPLTAAVPPTWDVRRGPGGALLLSGRSPTGEREIALRDGPRIATFDVPATQPFTPDSPGSPNSTRIEERDGMRIVERIERAGSIDLPADKAPVRWTFRFIVAGSELDRPSYELDILNLTQLTYEREEEMLRTIINSVLPAAAP